MPSRGNTGGGYDTLVIKALTCMMFFTFAMTTDAVGSIIPDLLEEFALSLKAASAFHYVPMAAIAAGALGLGYLADRIGRKATILIGLAIYAASSLLFAFGDRFEVFVVLLGAAGVGVSVFKIGALALIGDFSRSTREHTDVHEHGRGILRRRRDRRAGHRGDAAHRGALVEILVRGGRRHLRAAHHHGGSSALSTHSCAGRRAGDVRPHVGG